MQRLGELGALLAPGAELRAPLALLAVEPRAGLLGMAQLRLEACHLGIRRVECALSRVHRIAGLVVRRARRLQARLERARLCVLRLELVGDACELRRLTLALGGGIAPAQVPQQLLLQLQVALQLLVTRRHLRLRIELLDLQPELEAYVGDAREVLARVGKPRLGFPPPLLVFGDAGGLFED